MSLSLKTITVEFDGEHKFIMATRYENGKKIVICLCRLENPEAYVGDASDVYLRSMAAGLRMTYSDYLIIALNAFQFNNERENSKFLYSLEKENGDFYFRWKQVIENEEVKVNLGRIKMAKKNYNLTMETLLCEISEELYTTRCKLDEVTNELEKSNSSKRDMQDLLENAIQTKDNLEKEMYSKFVLVLNRKKQELRQLKRKHEKENSSDEEHISSNVRPKLTKKNHSKYQKLSLNNMSDDEVSTDEDIHKPGSSVAPTKAHNLSFLFDEESDSEIKYPVSQPRQRKCKIPEQKAELQNSGKMCTQSSSTTVPGSSKRQIFISEDDTDEDLLDIL